MTSKLQPSVQPLDSPPSLKVLPLAAELGRSLDPRRRDFLVDPSVADLPGSCRRKHPVSRCVHVRTAIVATRGKRQASAGDAASTGRICCAQRGAALNFSNG